MRGISLQSKQTPPSTKTSVQSYQLTKCLQLQIQMAINKALEVSDNDQNADSDIVSSFTSAVISHYGL